MDDVIHYDRIVKIRKEMEDEKKLGIPTQLEIENFLLNNIPIPSKVKYESMTDAQIEALVPTSEQILEEILKGKTTSEQEKPKVEADGLPSVEDIAESMGVKLPKESV